ncbi:MAG: hypothetical protein Q9175_002188 [Cornicularia normoerica]
MARQLASTVVGAVALLLGIVTATLMVILAETLISDHQESYALPLAAAVIQFLSCGSLAMLIYHKLRYDQILALQAGQTFLPILLFGVLPSLVALAVVGAALGWAEARIVGRALSILGLSESAFLTIIFIVWGSSIGAHVLCYSSFAWFARSTQKRFPQRSTTEGPLDEAPQEMREASRSATATTLQSNPFHEQLSSSLPSLIASDGTSSLRSSFSTTQRPSSSRRGLLIRQHSNTRHSQRSSLDGPTARPSQDEGFDWDTSGVSPQIRETVLQSKPMMKGSGLPPIPGSRSPSPAKALEGPFFQSSPSLSPPGSPLPQPSVSRPSSPSSPSELPNFTTMFPPSSNPPPTSPLQRNFSRPGSRSGPISRSGTISHSRPGSRSRALSEDHIHPLFRTCSPVPSPGASPGTIVTAAPEAGQLIDGSMLKRMRSGSGSLPSSPSPLVRSESSPDIRTARGLIVSKRGCASDALSGWL